MAEVDAFIRRCDDVLQRGDKDEADNLAREIIVAFNPSIPNISNYRGMTGTGPHTLKDLRRLRGKIAVYRDACDDAKYGAYAVGTVTESIRRLEEAQSNKMTVEQLRELFKEIDYVFVDKDGGYTQGLAGWDYNGDLTEDNSDFQIRLRITKLRELRDDMIRKLELAKAQGSSTTISQNLSNSVQVSIDVSMEQAIDRIDELDDLDEEQKTVLMGMLADIRHSAEKDAPILESKTHKLLGWLSDKGIDVLLAALPYLMKLLANA